MPNVAQDDQKAFGLAVKRARSLRGWTLDALGAAFTPPVGKSFISKVERGQKDGLSARTVGRFIKALDLDEAWIDRFLDTAERAETDETDETKAERDADRILNRLEREGAAGEASEELLIQLANRYAEGNHRDIETAYVAVKLALDAAEAMRQRGALGGDNTESQLNAVLAEVARRNAEGDLDGGDALLEAEERRMREAHKANRDRMEQEAEALLEQRLAQDRLRNDPEAAAERLIARIRASAPAGGVFWAVDAKAREWNVAGNRAGDMFQLGTALAMAKRNYEASKSKKHLVASALLTLGWCHFRSGERSANDRHLTVARNAFEGALAGIAKNKDPQFWSAAQNGLGATLQRMGERAGDAETLLAAVAMQREALAAAIAARDVAVSAYWDSLGITLQSLGELTRDPAALTEAVEALTTALARQDRQTDPLRWELTQNNLSVAQRWLGEVTGDTALLDAARLGYAACETLNFEAQAPFQWARLQWNIADLALARFRLTTDPALLDEATRHVTAARAFFVNGSDHQTARCDALIAQIAEARASQADA